MKREEAEKIWRQKFEAFGFNECFEFLYRNWNTHKGRKCVMRCRECGVEFESWAFAECVKGRQAHILCLNCGVSSDGNDKWTRSPQCDAAMEYYVQGHTVKETAERFNATINQINNIVKHRGLTNGRSWRDCQDHITQQKKEAEKNLAQHLLKMGFDYIGGYSGRDSRVKIKCMKCGAEFSRGVDSIRDGNTVCLECQKAETIKRQTEMKQQRIFELEQKRKAREEKKQIAEAEKTEAFSHLLNDKTHVCSVCGKYFSILEFMESQERKLIPTNPKYCSHECYRKAKNRLCKKSPSHKRSDNHRHRAKKYGCEYVPGITLKKLVQRDGLKCQICGGMCDWNDHSWSKYSGPTYPSLDHIIPLAKGGSHTWENVQVAHMMCNSQKCDKVEAIS